MTDLLEIMQKRRSIRRYSETNITEDKIERILQAGLLSPSSRSIRPWEFIVVRNKGMLKYLAGCRTGNHAGMLAGADCAIVVVADAEKSDTWIEDCAITMTYMQLMASSLEVGSCWIQGRLRNADDLTTEDYLRKKLHFPDTYRLAAILSLGIPAAAPKPHALENLPWDKIHQKTY